MVLDHQHAFQKHMLCIVCKIEAVIVQDDRTIHCENLSNHTLETHAAQDTRVDFKIS